MSPQPDLTAPAGAGERGWTGREWPAVLPGVALGLAGTLVAVASQRDPAVSNVLPLAFLVVLTVAGLVVSAWKRHADWWLAMLIVILAMFPNSSVDPALRIVAGGFRLFARLLFGVLSLWDVLLGLLLVLALWMHAWTGSRTRHHDRATLLYVVGLAVVCCVSALNGLIHASILDFGPTSFRSVVQQSLPVVYLFAAIVIGRLAIVDQRSVWKVIWAVRLSVIAVLVQGTLLFLLALRDQYSALRGFGGIPIVLYDQLGIVNVFACLMIARYAVRARLRAADWLMLMGSVLFLLMSTRRLVLIMVVLDTLFILALTLRRRDAIRTALRVGFATVAVIALVVSLAVVAVPRFVEAVRLVVTSLNVTSDVGVQFAGGIRVAELDNLARNLGSGPTPFWVLGRGLGTYWREYVPMGLSLNVGSTAFTEAVLGAGASGWWPDFHLPYISVLYRFGIAGALAIWVLVVAWVLKWWAMTRDLTPQAVPFAVMVVVLAAGQILSIGESLDSAGPALLGLLMAALAGLGVAASGEPRGTAGAAVGSSSP